jgi:aminoglycoside phosphotransferase (APT) family kinase protein
MASLPPFPQALAGSDLGRSLQPALERACRGKLTNIRWFKTDWQRGGAATGFADAMVVRDSVEGWETERQVVIKAPIGWTEYRALRDLGHTTAPTPRVLMMGTELEPYDFAWVVMERIPGHPIATRLDDDPKHVFDMLADAVARFYMHCHACWGVPDSVPIRYDWNRLLGRAIASLGDNPTIAHQERWLSAIEHTRSILDRLLAVWRSRSTETWCHGDLHPGNAMIRPPGSPWGEPGVVLLDFAEMRPGHWVEDAVYLERLFWAREPVSRATDPVQQIAEARARHGLVVEDNYGELADIRRLLRAAAAPAFVHMEGHPVYLNACLERAEAVLARLG